MRLLRHWRLGALVLVVVGVAAFLLLRGGDEGGRELTHAQFAERADQICADQAAGNQDLPPPPVPYGSISVDFFDGLYENVSRARDRFEELNPPAEDDDAFGALVDSYDAMATRIEEASGAASVDQSSEVDTLVQEVAEESEEAAAAERQLGICEGETSARISIGVVVRREGENPLTETGTLGE
jgi:hypothetical protein